MGDIRRVTENGKVKRPPAIRPRLRSRAESTAANHTPLTPRQQRFVLEYVRDLNVKAASKRAGYSSTRADLTGRALLRVPKVAAAVQAKLDETARAAKMDAVEVLSCSVEMLQSDVRDIMDDAGNYRPLSEWPTVWRKMLSSFDVETIRNAKGDEVGRITKVKFIDKIKVLELIGKHINVRAFVTQHEVSGPDGGPIKVTSVDRVPTDRLEQMREWLMDAAANRALPTNAPIDAEMVEG